MSLDVVIDLLACPACGGSLSLAGATATCASGHAFDVARQGFVTLSRAGIRHPGDTAEMVVARARVQQAGVLGVVLDEVVDAIPGRADALADVGAGVGTYAAAVLEAGRSRRAVALDASKPALRRAARAHPALGAVGCDLVEGIPLRDRAVDAAILAFAPRHAAELARVVAPGGTLVVVTPRPAHLGELVAPLGLLDVPPGKAEEVTCLLVADFELLDRVEVTDPQTVDRSLAADLALMGPAGFHTSAAALAERAAGLPDSLTTTVAVTVSRFRRR